MKSVSLAIFLSLFGLGRAYLGQRRAFVAYMITFFLVPPVGIFWYVVDLFLVPYEASK